MNKAKIILSGLISAIVLGVSGFILGFIGPMVFSPGANQGPMLGIFITGPGGLILGALIGSAVGNIKQQNETHKQVSRFNIPKIWRHFLIGIAILAAVLVAVSSVQIPWHQKNYSESIHDRSDIENRDKSLTRLNVRFITDNEILLLQKFKQLHFLDFQAGWGAGEAKITDAGLKNLSVLKLPELKTILFGYCSNITDNGLQHLTEIRSLKHLNLNNCNQISDSGLASIASITGLKRLNLSGNQNITDRGLEQLQRLPKLKKLWLRGCDNLSEAGIKELQKALPDCKIYSRSLRK